jgi:SUMO ligase MMS21 Smc5/6 complex component
MACTHNYDMIGIAKKIWNICFPREKRSLSCSKENNLNLFFRGIIMSLEKRSSLFFFGKNAVALP